MPRQMIRYDGKSQNLHTKPEKFRNELYRSSGNEEGRGWQFSGLINHSLEIQKIEEASAGLDKALETLQSQMASIKQQRDAQKCVLSSVALWRVHNSIRCTKRQPRLLMNREYWAIVLTIVTTIDSQSRRQSCAP